ncbi:XTP/dITP diphosphohydrolase [Thermolongibacillus altinsuensis]|uniref:dITP/XTP pyrophosphatase n=1 Tax=Thermolongibacillus altinsuensis TaxID=575256 RepID=A0A4R1QG09_9BACL|nr:XTP/dITP diphosphatase [Thermolongibacillus altinsuensis]TCL51891.1 XTP/dITP diphosphohydrolase [Thermolongibacillus altinsuensis]GMB07425.1 non-canonical purine NTP pyrophosphatase [Thermolongibacillus altinsuensis]
MKRVIIATRNKGKVAEFEQLFSKKGIEVQSLLDYNECPDVEETGATFAENAILKAKTIAQHLKETVIADDSGLIVDALGGRPGVYSARYAGEAKDDQANIQKVLQELEGVPFEKRTARFHCTLAVATPDGRTFTVDGTCEGYITEKPIGTNGFGYDPIFYVPEKQKTMAQLTKEEKNEISHRANALKRLEQIWDEAFVKES